MAETLSSRQEAILKFIRDEIQKRGYPPAVREIGAAVGLSSTSTVHAHLNQLEAKGYIRRDPSKPRAIEVINYRKPEVWEEQDRPDHRNDAPLPESRQDMVDVPILGAVAAGAPILAVEDPDVETFALPLEFLRTEDVFMLTVQGDSMLNAGIHDGDYVVARKQPAADNGEIVVALLEDEATVKRFYKGASHVRLQPENDLYEPIITRDVQILGKVIALLRRY
jgi:repressor LexA